MIDHVLACLTGHADNLIEPPAPSPRWNSPWTSSTDSPKLPPKDDIRVNFFRDCATTSD